MTRTDRSGGYRMSRNDMLAYGFKTGEPWGDDRRALEHAFREVDAQSDESYRSYRTSESGSTRTATGSGSNYGGSTLSTLSTMSSLSSRPSTRSGGSSTAYQESWGSRRSFNHDRAPSVLEVVRVGREGRGSSAYREPGSRSSATTAYRFPRREEEYVYRRYSDDSQDSERSFDSDSEDGYSSSRDHGDGSVEGTLYETGLSGYNNGSHHESDSEPGSADYYENESGFVEGVESDDDDSVGSEGSYYASDSNVASDGYDSYDDYSD